MGYNNEAVRENGGAEARRDSLEKVLKKALDKRAAKWYNDWVALRERVVREGSEGILKIKQCKEIAKRNKSNPI